VTRPLLLLLPVLLACGAPADDPYGGDPAERLLDVNADGEGLVPHGKGFAVKIAGSWRENPSIPDGIRDRLAAGNDWILLREPVVFAGAARWIAAGGTPFVPQQIELRAPHDRRDDELGRSPPLRPALLVMRGTMSAEAAPKRYRIVRIEGLSVGRIGLDRGIKALDSEVDRVALGRGVETSMQLATGSLSDGIGQSSYDWMATFKDGEPVPDEEWIAAIDKSAEERQPYVAVVRRYRPSSEPRETWFGVPLNVVLLCSQMRLSDNNAGGFAWEWEGFWLGRLGKPESAPGEPVTPPVRVVYAEFRSSEKERRGGDYLSSVFDPVTRTGKTALDELKKRSADAFIPTTK